jgi:5-methylcytosine-specific restriction endonuclease McrA
MKTIIIDRTKCFECGSTENIHYHHVVPKSKGGTQMIPLCAICHSIVHDAPHLTNKTSKEKKPYYEPGSMELKKLQREGIERTKINEPWKYSGRKHNTKEDILKFLSKPKNAKAVEYLKKGFKCGETAKLVGLHINTITKIKKNISL